MIIDAETALFGVLGNPVAHSLSPQMHNRALSHLGQNGIYLAFQVTDLASAVCGIRGLGLRGASITLPHKVAIMDYLDHVDPEARAIGAVNTVVNRHSRLHGYNTDGRGALRALEEKTPVKNKRVLIIGAGGAARAIGFAVTSAGGRLTISNRTRPRGEALAKDLGAAFLPMDGFSAQHFDILINTTSVGMNPHSDSQPVDSRMLAPAMTVMDIVYNPLKTRLLEAAERIGCTVVDGLAMFVYQGALQFELWTGIPAPIKEMRETVLKALNPQPD